ncbi:MAG: DUF2971 domain-containing protein [Rhodobacteraceae bacterium]|nr:DUF2971 domain-containing protein [Paracoccaceae bacterium]
MGSSIETSDQPDVLWHYTTFSTLRKIVETQSLLGRDYRLLNDSTEVKQGAKWIADWVRHQKDFDYGPDGADYFCDRLEDFEEEACPFVISFSAARDKLSMWRGYADAVHGSEGVAIGFDRADLRAITYESNFIGPTAVAYDHNSFLKIVSVVTDFDLTPLSGWEGYLNLKMVPALVKHEAFVEEAEWRIADLYPYKNLGTEFVEVEGEQRLKLKLTTNKVSLNYMCGIRKVLVGPKGNKAAVDNFVRVALRGEAGTSNVLVEKSDIPFL